MKKVIAFLIVGLVIVAISVVVIVLIQQSNDLDKPKPKTPEEELIAKIEEEIDNIGPISLQSGDELFEIMDNLGQLSQYYEQRLQGFVEDGHSLIDSSRVSNYAAFTEAKDKYVTQLKESLIGEWLATSKWNDKEYNYLKFGEDTVYWEAVSLAGTTSGSGNTFRKEFTWDIDQENIFQIVLHPASGFDRSYTEYYNIVFDDGVIQYLYRSKDSEPLDTIPTECNDESERLYRLRD